MFFRADTDCCFQPGSSKKICPTFVHFDLSINLGEWTDWEVALDCGHNHPGSPDSDRWYKKMTRTCKSPNNDPPCVGSDTKYVPCEAGKFGPVRQCQWSLWACLDLVDGGWTDWDLIKDCYENDNGQGWIKHETRTCDDPEPAYGGQPCQGQAEQFPVCPAVNGGWTSWTPANDEDCSYKSATGSWTKPRSRSCTNPEPEYGGSDCSPDGDGTGAESTMVCPPGNPLY